MNLCGFLQPTNAKNVREADLLMCGYVGFTNKINNANQVIAEMMDKIKHRGPDSEGKYVDGDIALGFRRLSIIDLNSLHHPI